MVLAGHTKAEHADFNDHQGFLSSIAGIVFLGTPHRGSRLASLASLKARVGGLIGYQSYPEILSVLRVDSTTTVLAALQEEFSQLSKVASLKDLELFCFYETKEVVAGVSSISSAHMFSNFRPFCFIKYVSSNINLVQHS